MKVLLLIAVLAAFVATVLGSDYYLTPFGYVHKKCISKMSGGDHLYDHGKGKGVSITSEAGEKRHIPTCDVPAHLRIMSEDPSSPNAPQKQKKESRADGWQVYTQFNNANNVSFDSFLGYFNVPQRPAKSGFDTTTVFLFTGLQNDDWVPLHGPPFSGVPRNFDIIQPVLQWGPSAAGGGDYWSLASWYVTTDDGAIFSQPKRLEAGDVIFGNMTQTGTNTWFIGSEVTAKQIVSNIHVTKPRLASQAWAFVTLEVYGLHDCEEFPPSSSPCVFDKMSLTTKGMPTVPQWESKVGGTTISSCNQKLSVLSPSRVVIKF